MNSFIKYLPMFYTWNSRIKSKNNSKKESIVELVYYIWNNLWMPIFMIIYLWLFFERSNNFIFLNIILFIFLYFIHNTFYEIWYIFNDNISSKKEKKPTRYVEQNMPKKFWNIQILARIIIWILLRLCLESYSKNWAILMAFDICAILFFYSIHNHIRNYSINMFTVPCLRCTRFVLIIILFNIINFDLSTYSNVFFTLFTYRSLDLAFSRYSAYNKRLWWTNNLLYGYTYFFISIMFILLFIIQKDIVFLIPFIIIFTKILRFLIMTPKAFSLKNNR